MTRCGIYHSSPCWVVSQFAKLRHHRTSLRDGRVVARVSESAPVLQEFKNLTPLSVQTRGRGSAVRRHFHPTQHITFAGTPYPLRQICFRAGRSPCTPMRSGTHRPKTCCECGFWSIPSADSRLPDSDTITLVQNRPAAFTRRKLSAVVRKAITSYYTEQERQEIAEAAKRQGVSMSSFIALAALKESRRAKRNT